MPGLDIRLNSKSYVLSPREDGTKLVTRPVRQFFQPIRQTGRTRPEDVAPYETFIHPNMTYGFGRYRINSDAAFEPSEYRRCWDSHVRPGGWTQFIFRSLEKMQHRLTVT